MPPGLAGLADAYDQSNSLLLRLGIAPPYVQAAGRSPQQTTLRSVDRMKTVIE
jgi:hypothetical protein